jgi:hypothetical protein
VEEDEHVIDMVQRSPQASTQWIIANLIVRSLESAEYYTGNDGYTYNIQRIQHLEPTYTGSRLEICRWIKVNHLLIHRVLFTVETHFTRDVVNSTGQFCVWDHDT